MSNIRSSSKWLNILNIVKIFEETYRMTFSRRVHSMNYIHTMAYVFFLCKLLRDPFVWPFINNVSLWFAYFIVRIIIFCDRTFRQTLNHMCAFQIWLFLALFSIDEIYCFNFRPEKCLRIVWFKSKSKVLNLSLESGIERERNLSGYCMKKNQFRLEL